MRIATGRLDTPNGSLTECAQAHWYQMRTLHWYLTFMHRLIFRVNGQHLCPTLYRIQNEPTEIQSVAWWPPQASQQCDAARLFLASSAVALVVKTFLGQSGGIQIVLKSKMLPHDPIYFNVIVNQTLCYSSCITKNLGVRLLRPFPPFFACEER